jgi:hypothetical protein
MLTVSVSPAGVDVVDELAPPPQAARNKVRLANRSQQVKR